MDDGIDHVWPEDKGRWLEDVATKQGLHQRELAAVGDSGGDREMLAAAGRVSSWTGRRVPGSVITVAPLLRRPLASMLSDVNVAWLADAASWLLPIAVIATTIVVFRRRAPAVSRALLGGMIGSFVGGFLGRDSSSGSSGVRWWEWSPSEG